MKQLLILALLGAIELFAMEEIPVGRMVIRPGTLRLTELYHQLRSQYDRSGSHHAISLIPLPLEIIKYRAYLQELRSQECSPDKGVEWEQRINDLELLIRDTETTIRELQKEFDESRLKREKYRFSK